MNRAQKTISMPVATQIQRDGQPVEHVHDRPAILGGAPAFQEKLPFMRPTLPSPSVVEGPIRQCLETGMLTKGMYLDQFEQKLASYLGVKHAVAVSSCTTGLMLVYKCLGLTGEVVVPSFTFMATVHPLVWQGATPVFVDIDPDTWNVDPAQVEAAITPRTSAIVGVHVFGNPAAVEVLEAIARRHQLPLIFDAAHGFGALHQGRPVGGNGVAEVFSASPTKLLVTGEGGVVATNDDALAHQLRIAREYGNDGSYDSVLPGINARMQEFSAILGLHGLDILEDNARQRNALAQRYQAQLVDLPGIGFQRIAAGDRSSYKDYTIRIEPQEFGLDRDGVRAALDAEGIDTRLYYVPPVHRHTTYRELTARQQPHLPVTDRVAEQVLSLPMYSHMPPAFVDRVCEALKRIHHYASEIRIHLEDR